MFARTFASVQFATDCCTISPSSIGSNHVTRRASWACATTHVLHTHGSQKKKGIAVPTVLDERIEEYILQGIAEEFHPTFNEDVISSETLKHIDVENVAVTMEKSVCQLPEIENAKVGQVIDAPISHFNFQMHFSAEEFFMVKLCNICDKANVPHHVVDDVVNLLR